MAESVLAFEAVYEKLRANYPVSLGGLVVTSIRDMGTGLDTSTENKKPALPWVAGDLMITFTLADGKAVLTLRASGTEPKLKWYLEVTDPDKNEALKIAQCLQDDAMRLIAT
eukprot:scaffold1628_cov407-Prasinococcus_capsulatus_cf.AAC.23